MCLTERRKRFVVLEEFPRRFQGSIYLNRARHNVPIHQKKKTHYIYNSHLSSGVTGWSRVQHNHRLIQWSFVFPLLQSGWSALNDGTKWSIQINDFLSIKKKKGIHWFLNSLFCSTCNKEELAMISTLGCFLECESCLHPLLSVNPFNLLLHTSTPLQHPTDQYLKKKGLVIANNSDSVSTLP